MNIELREFKQFKRLGFAADSLLSVVVPVYRSQETLRPLYRRLVDTLTSLGMSFEIIFIDDCGGDNSWRLISELAVEDERVRGFLMSRNFGQHNALLR